MKKSAWMRMTAGGVLRDTRGTEIAETAVVLPLLFVVLIAIFWFGQAFRIYGTITHAAREGARAAVAPVCATCPAGNTPEQNAAAAVTKVMAAAHLNTAQLQPLGTWTPPAFTSCGSSAACAQSPTINICVQKNVQLASSGAGGGGTCGTSVSLRYRYPYHFTLPCWPQPCTSMDLGKISLPAQAEMRLETQ